jgi:Flp pilus assembly protein TadD
LFQRGMLADAVELYRQIAGASPDAFVALNNCGVALEQLGRLDEALASIDDQAGLCRGVLQSRHRAVANEAL